MLADSLNVANAKSSGVSGGIVGVGVSLGKATVNAPTSASLNGPVTTNGNITIQATGKNTADVKTFAFSVGLGAAGAGGGAVAEITDKANVTASVGSGATLTTSGAVLVRATADNDAIVQSDAGSGGFGAAITGSDLSAKIAGSVRAQLDGDVNGASSVKVEAIGNNNAQAKALAISIGIGLAGAGADAYAEVTNKADVEALVGSTAQITAPGAPIDVLATGDNSAFASAEGGSGGVGIAISAMLPEARIGGAVTAQFDGDLIDGAFDALSLNVKALGENTATAVANVASISLGSGAGSQALAVIAAEADVQASIGMTASIATAGAVVVDARLRGDKNKARAEANGLAGGVLAGVSIMLAKSVVEGAVIAELDGDITASSGVTVSASGANLADADTRVAGFGLAFGGAGSGTVAEVSSNADVQALVGSTSSIDTSGEVHIAATSDNDALVESDAGSGGIAAITGSALSATIAGGTKAELRGDVDGATSIDVRAVGNNDAFADALAISFGLFAAAVVDPDAEITSSAAIEALIGSGSEIDSPEATVNVDAQGTHRATAQSTGASASIVGIQIMDVDATVRGATRAAIQSGADVTAGTLNIEASATTTPTVNVLSTGISLVGGGAASAVATDAHVVEALGGGIINAQGTGNITLNALLNSTVRSNASMLGLGLFGSGSFSTSSVSATPTVRANFSSGAQVAAEGDISASATGNVDARATGTGTNLSIGIGFSGARTTATVNPTVQALTVGGGSLEADDITFIASSNALADARVSVGAGGLLAGVAGGSATATSTPNLDAGIGALTGVDATGNVRVDALSTNEAEARARGTGGGLVGVGASVANATATSNVEAYMKGSIGTSTGAGAADLDLSASAADSAIADAQAVAGGLVAGTLNSSDATVDSTVAAYIGANSFVNVSDDISITALADPEADASTKGVTGGFIGVGGSDSDATVTPDVSAYVDSGAVVIAGGGISLEATNTPLATGGAAPNYSITGVSNNALTVANHGLTTGDTVEYENGSNAPIAGLTGRTSESVDGGETIIVRREYSVLANDANHISFGAGFDGSDIDAARDTITFTNAHNFRNGDAVRYAPDSGATAVGGLNLTDTYYVVSVDDKTVRLVASASEVGLRRIFSPSAVSGSVITLGGHGFSNGDTVTYDAPDAFTFNSINVDVVVASTTPEGALVFNDSAGADNIYFIDSEGRPVNHGFVNGDRIVYQLQDGTIQIDPLVNGREYRVTNATASSIQLKFNDALLNEPVNFVRSAGGDQIIQTDGGSWIDSGFGAGQSIHISGSGINNGTSYTIASVGGFNNSVLTLAQVNTVTGTQVAATVNWVAAVAGGDPADDFVRIQRVGGDWANTNFTAGQTIDVSGTNGGNYTIRSVSGSTIELQFTGAITAASGVAATISNPVNKNFDAPVIALTPDKGPSRAGDPPAPRPNPDPGAVVHSFIKASDRPIALSGGGALQDGVTYYVKNATAGSFELSATDGGPSLAFNASGLSGVHAFSPVVDLSAASDDHSLRIALPGGAFSGTHTILGAGGIPLSLVTAVTGDGISSANARGSGGGFVGVNINDATATFNTTTKAYIAADIVSAEGAVSIVTDAKTNATASSRNGTGGFVGIGDADANSRQTSVTESYIGENVNLLAGSLSIIADTNQNSDVSTHSNAGGFVGLADATSDSNMSYTTTATVKEGANVAVGGHADIDAGSRTRADSYSYASGIGAGGDGESQNDIDYTSALTQAEVAQNAIVTARTLAMNANTTRIKLTSDGQAYGAGIYSEGEDDSDVSISAQSNVVIGANAELTGIEGVDLIAGFSGVDTHAESFARSTGLFGWVSADANNDTTITSQVSGAAGARVIAGPRDPSDPNLQDSGESTHLALFASVDNGSSDVTRKANTSKRSLAGGGSHGNTNFVDNEDIDFSSDVLILSGRQPELIIDADGNITRAVEASVRDGAVTARTSGHINSTEIFVNDIQNPGPGDVVFDADGTISGSGGTWEFRDTLQTVNVTNLSTKNLKINDIKVLGNRDPLVWLDPDDASVSLTFAIERGVAPTLVDIRNEGASTLFLNGTIENPIGTTVIFNELGDVRATDDRDMAHVDFGKSRVSLVRSNILNVDAGGEIGISVSERVNIDIVDAPGLPQSSTFETRRVSPVSGQIAIGFENQFFTGQLLRYDTSGTPIVGLTPGHYYYAIVSQDGLSLKLSSSEALVPIALSRGSSPLSTVHTLTAATRFDVDAGTAGSDDVYLDLKARQRGLAGAYTVSIDNISAGGNVDVLLQASVRELTSTTTSGGVLVKHPGDTDGDIEYVFFDEAESTVPPLRDTGFFASGTVSIDSTYDFRAADTNGERKLPGLVAGKNIIVNAQDPSPSAAKINVIGNTDTLGVGFSEGPSDEHHVDVLTNGFITLTEINDDLRVGRIKSTASDVLLYSPAAIVDALNDFGSNAEADVSGENITLDRRCGRRPSAGNGNQSESDRRGQAERRYRTRGQLPRDRCRLAARCIAGGSAARVRQYGRRERRHLPGRSVRRHARAYRRLDFGCFAAHDGRFHRGRETRRGSQRAWPEHRSGCQRRFDRWFQQRSGDRFFTRLIDRRCRPGSFNRYFPDRNRRESAAVAGTRLCRRYPDHGARIGRYRRTPATRGVRLGAFCGIRRQSARRSTRRAARSRARTDFRGSRIRTVAGRRRCHHACEQ